MIDMYNNEDCFHEFRATTYVTDLLLALLLYFSHLCLVFSDFSHLCLVFSDFFWKCLYVGYKWFWVRFGI